MRPWLESSQQERTFAHISTQTEGSALVFVSPVARETQAAYYNVLSVDVVLRDLECDKLSIANFYDVLFGLLFSVSDFGSLCAGDAACRNSGEASLDIMKNHLDYDLRESFLDFQPIAKDGCSGSSIIALMIWRNLPDFLRSKMLICASGATLVLLADYLRAFTQSYSLFSFQAYHGVSIADFYGLRFLNVAHTAIRELNTAWLPNLVELYAGDSALEVFVPPISGSLAILSAGRSSIEQLDVRTTGKLERLEIQATPVVSVPNVLLIRLKELNAASIPISSINDRIMPALVALDISHTQIGYLNLRGLRELRVLKISNTPIRSLDFSAAAGIYMLVAEGSLLQRACFSKLKGLVHVAISGSSIRHADCRGCKHLQYYDRAEYALEALEW